MSRKELPFSQEQIASFDLEAFGQQAGFCRTFVFSRILGSVSH